MTVPEAPRGIGRAMAVGASWTVGFKLVERLLGLASTMVLARLLTPDSFGLVAMATSVVMMIELFTVLGFEQALIRNQTAARVDYDTAWTINLSLQIMAAAAVVLLANPLASFFREERLPPFLYALSLLPILDGLANIGVVDFRKHMQFHRDFVLQVTRKLSAVVVMVALAFAWRSPWALVVGNIAGRLVGTSMSYFMHPFRPRLSLSADRSLLSYSLWIFLNGVLNFLRTQGANFIVGRFSGAHALGVYTNAYEIANLPTSQIVMPLNRAVMPGYARIAHERERIQAGFLQVLGLVALATIPAGVGVSNIAHLLVPVILGAQWLDAIPVVRWLAIFGVTLALQMNVQSLYNAIGRPYVNAAISAALVAILLPLLLLMVRESGAVGAAQAYAITGLCVLPVNYSIAARLIGLQLLDVVRQLWRPVLGSLCMTLALQWFHSAIGLAPGPAHLILQLFSSVALGAVSYLCAVLILWLLAGRPAGPERYTLGLLTTAARRLGGGASH